MQEHSQLVTLQNEIRSRYSTLSKRLKQVAQYVLDNHNSVIFDTVATISERAGVSSIYAYSLRKCVWV